MRGRSFFAAATFLVLAGCASAPAPAVSASPRAAETRAQVMVLGVYHFTQGGSDYVKRRHDDHLSPRRQAEIAHVLDRLERFRPTKIALELDPADEAQFNERYRRWLAGEGALGVDERDQLGMAPGPMVRSSEPSARATTICVSTRLLPLSQVSKATHFPSGDQSGEP